MESSHCTVALGATNARLLSGRVIQTDFPKACAGEGLGARKMSEWGSVPLDRAKPVVCDAGTAWNSGAYHRSGFWHDGQRTPGPGSPVATTRDEDAVNEHPRSVANRRRPPRAGGFEPPP